MHHGVVRLGGHAGSDGAALLLAQGRGSGGRRLAASRAGLSAHLPHLHDAVVGHGGPQAHGVGVRNALLFVQGQEGIRQEQARQFKLFGRLGPSHVLKRFVQQRPQAAFVKERPRGFGSALQGLLAPGAAFGVQRGQRQPRRGVVRFLLRQALQQRLRVAIGLKAAEFTGLRGGARLVSRRFFASTQALRQPQRYRLGWLALANGLLVELTLLVIVAAGLALVQRVGANGAHHIHRHELAARAAARGQRLGVLAQGLGGLARPLRIGLLQRAFINGGAFGRFSR